MRRRLFFGVLLLALLGAERASASPSDPTDLKELVAAFHLSSVHGDFVVVVDTSRSMVTSTGGPTAYHGVRAAYSAFVKAIPAGDRLAVVTFASHAQINFDAAISNANRSAALTAIPSETPAAFAGPEHAATDIGAGLAETLKRLEVPDANEVQTVIFLTDGQHQPPNGSPFTSTASPAWRSLTLRGRALTKHHILDSYGAGLGNAGATDISLMGRVFNNPSIVNLPASQLGPFFKQAILRSQALRLRKPLLQELRTGKVTAEVMDPPKLAGHVRLKVRLTSTYQHLPVDVNLSGLRLTVGGQPVKLSGAGKQSLRLPAKGSSVVEVEATLPVSKNRFRVPAKDESLQVTATATGTITARPSDEIKRLFGFPTSKPLNTAASTTLKRTVGYSVLKAIGAVLVLLLLLYLLARFFWWLLVPPLLPGYLELRDRARQPLELKGRRMRIDGKKIPEGGGAVIELFTRARQGKRVFVSVEKGDLTYKEGGLWVSVAASERLTAGTVYKLNGFRIIWWLDEPDKG